MGLLILRSTAVSGGGGGGAVLFDPGDLGAYANHDAIFTVDTNDHDGGISSLQSSVTRPGGSSKAIRIQYPNDEAGTQLIFPAFAPTPTLYYRWYMLLGDEWEGNYPIGLKTARSFTTNNWIAAVGESPSVLGDAYCGPKFVWMKYPDGSGFAPDGPGDPNGTAVWGCCIATMNVDVGAEYASPLDFAGNWMLLEVFQTINSADGAHDGTLELRVNKTTVYSSTTMDWVNSSAPHYTNSGLAGWQSMWFGGNCSYDTFGFPGMTMNRYEDGYFVSTDARWVP